MSTLIVRSTRVALPHGPQPAVVVVRDGRIDVVRDYDDTGGGDTLDAGDLLVLPGLVDTHVHCNEPGRTDWEGFATATRAAAAGGVTTIVDMPLNSVPATTTLHGLAAKRQAAEGQCHVDVGFWGGVVPGNAGELEGLARRGVRGFKCFLAPSGVEEFEHVSEDGPPRPRCRSSRGSTCRCWRTRSCRRDWCRWMARRIRGGTRRGLPAARPRRSTPPSIC
jgi:allantoinase